jgi:hypothetical protein
MKKLVITGLLMAGVAMTAHAAEKPAGKATAKPVKTVPAKSASGDVDVKDGLDIIGSQDAPLELNIIPWKDKENYLPKNPLEASVLNESLDPVDRDVVKREVDFSRALHSLPSTSP